MSAYCANEAEVGDGKQGGAAGAGAVSSIEDVQGKFASILGGKACDYDLDTPVQTYGLDSLSTTVLVNWVNNQQQQSAASPQPNITAEFFDDAMTVRKMFTYLKGQQQDQQQELKAE